VEESAALIRDEAGRVSGAVLVFRDITARRRVEQQLEEQPQVVEEANRRLEMLAATD
jgi:signal transduction histidine kinase